MAPMTRSMTAKANSHFNNPPSLLGLPGGVENLLLSFVSSGKGGLRDVLNLRAVCKTTHSWVDNLPKRQAGIIFSNVEVKIRRTDIVDSARRFLDSPPPFGVAALSIGANHLYPSEAVPRKDWKLWTRFYAFWTPRLETLELEEECFRFLSTRPRPSLRKHLYDQLQGMPNLRKLTVALFDVTDFALIRKFIEFKDKDNKSELPLQIHLTPRVDKPSLRSIDGVNPFGAVNIGERDRSREELRNFAACVVSSKLNIQLHFPRPNSFRSDAIFPKFKTFVPTEDFLGLCKLIVSIEHLELTRDQLNLRDIFPQLRILELVEVPSFIDLQQLTFPASLEELGIVGLPQCHRLPAALTSLSLCGCRCDVRTLLSSLMSLNESCPSLETLKFNWDFKASREPVGNVAISPGFANLRSLVFTGELEKKANTAASRLAILNGFQWDQMKLNYLALSFKGHRLAELPVVGKELLVKILEGPTVQTLLRVGMRDDVVTPEGLPLLQKLRSLAAENWKRREASEGEGDWTRHSFPRFVERNLRQGP